MELGYRRGSRHLPSRNRVDAAPIRTERPAAAPPAHCPKRGRSMRLTTVAPHLQFKNLDVRGLHLRVWRDHQRRDRAVLSSKLNLYRFRRMPGTTAAYPLGEPMADSTYYRSEAARCRTLAAGSPQSEQAKRWRQL